MNKIKGHCIPCEGFTKPMTLQAIQLTLDNFPHWVLIGQEPYKIQKRFTFNTFTQAMAFVNQVADIAQQEGHHPDMYIFYNTVVIELYTHAVNGLTPNDFILAGLIDSLDQQ